MSIEEQQLRQEVAFLKEQLEIVADGVTEQKYLQQAKKLRELSVKLDSEKARVAKLQQTIIKNERQQSERSEAERRGVLLPSSSSASAAGGGKGNNNNNNSAAELEVQHLTNQLNDIRSKLDRSSTQNASLRAQLDKRDKEMSKFKKILVAEIGDEATVDKLLNLESTSEQQQQDDNASIVTTNTTTTAVVGGYRARAQQISLLQAKVKDLNRKLNEQISVGNNNNNASEVGSIAGGVAPSVVTHVTASGVSTTIKDYDATHRSAIAQQESKKSAEIRSLQQAVEEGKELVAKEKQRGDALSSRVHVLEKQAQQLRSSLQQVIAKTENDNNLIDAYKQEIENQRTEIRQLQLVGGGGGGAAATTSARLQAGSNSVAFASPRQMAQYNNNGSSSPSSNNNNNSSSNTADLAKIQQLEKEVSKLQKQLSTVAISSSSSNNNDNNENKQETKNLDSAIHIVESQRKMILSLEQRLQSVESNNNNAKSNSNNNENKTVTQALRDENASLKERMSAMMMMVEREVELKKAQLEAKYSNNNNNSSNNVVVPTATASTTKKRVTEDLNTGPLPPPRRGSAIQEQQQQATTMNTTSTATSASASAPTRSSRPTLVSKKQQQQQQQESTTTTYIPPPPPGSPPSAPSHANQRQFVASNNNDNESDDDNDQENDAAPEYHDDNQEDGYYSDEQEEKEIASISTRSVPAMGASSSSARPLSLRGL